ncbi:tyrosine-type recombinase/integrase [Campylobacter sp. RM9344]|uniref:Tyrosine-type recombinase/integrase n=1 Tax=Campylobacter californiensis TaxID=1032243 RepID=A0AAW3ZYC5_9BACT|nr:MULTISPECIES: site-specific integrase [unclassified Campylobacter]MBE2985428.1 tyrosine-type recombinase/integrase [Campylobacter sp. RM6883]MBE2986846.1 tyrosine-type recombinase/integrase [Campylobacter sp. RM12919]MBE2988595.1 tyrosine-type recombinase/integrase [Campylobacter sp. RM12920]MBE2995641.1 tyrosine-type recombinase/integrase [Campylobacter sp. RM6913]MBE3029706.1 tyrosine-type recombinase/integrase [Campylobacter sp. RM9344]
MEISTEKQIESITVASGKKEFSVKGVKGLKLFCYATGGKIFKFKYQLGSSYTTKTLGEWIKAVYGIKQAQDDAIEVLKKLRDGEEIGKTSVQIKNFGELWAMYKQDALKTQKFKTLQGELSRFEFNLLSALKNTDMQIINIPSKATPLFLDALRSIQTTDNPKSDTVKKLLGRLNQVFDYAIIKGLIQANPTRILSANFSKNFIKVQSEPRKAIVDVDKFKILLSDINEYWGDINVINCLKWTILYALRPSNARLARWEDVDLIKKEWVINGEYMKMGETFILPLTDEAIEFLQTQKMYNRQNSGFIFEGVKHGAPISDNSMRMMLKKLGYDGKMDVHGFRSSLRTILSELNFEEKLGFTEEILSLCIDHKLRNIIKSDESYQRAKFEKAKREVFEYWHKRLREWGLKF